MKIKICGVTRIDDAEAAVAAGADFLGLNFWPGSKRYVAPQAAATIAAAVRGRITLVGVFVDQNAQIAEIAREVGLDIAQLHGDETPAEAAQLRRALPVWHAFPATDDVLGAIASWAEAPLDAMLLDAPSAGRGGSGKTVPPALAAAVRAAAPWPLVLAGGLTPATVAAAVAAVQPWAVDVASGVERSPGIKDAAAITAFVAAARGSS
jgi:phosphoribosylanthranilate isomerase